MGGKSTSQQQSQSVSNPWEPAKPLLTGILGQLQNGLSNTGLTANENNALNQIATNAQSANEFAPQIKSLASDLFAGGGANAQAGNLQSGLDAYRTQLTPYASGSMIGNNPALKAQLDTIMSDVGNSINSQFAAAGRDLSGANQQAYGRGVAQGIAPVLAQQYNQDVNNQIAAAGQLYNAGNTTGGLLSGLNQQALANRGQGVDVASAAVDAKNAGANAMLQIEAQRRGIPLQNLGLLAQLGVPIAGLGGQTNSSGSGSQTMSGAQQFGLIAGGIKNLFGPLSAAAGV